MLQTQATRKRESPEEARACDRIRKLVVDSGPEHLGTWRVHQRNLVADYERAFGEKPGPLMAIGKMTDADNTRASAEAWYGPIELLA